MSSAEGQDVIEGAGGCFIVDFDGNRVQGLQKLSGLSDGDPPAPFRCRQDIGNFEEPMGWDEGNLRGKATKQGSGQFRGFIRKGPGHRNRTIHDKCGAHGRPSLIKSLIFKPPRLSRSLSWIMLSIAWRRSST